MRPNHAKRSRRGFTLTELLVVVGLIAVMLSMLMPALGKVRAAANSANCLSNLRQMGVAWTMYTSTESKGRLPEYMFGVLGKPDVSYRGYWLGILDAYKVNGDVLLCPQAHEQVGFKAATKGFGTIWEAWSGKHTGSGTVVKFNNTLYRDGSYGYNRYLTATGKFASDLSATKLTSVRPLSEVPLFMDCVYIDAEPENGTFAAPAKPPPNLRGADPGVVSNEHWRFLIARHGRGINVCLADGSARRVPLEEMYLLRWKAQWLKYRLSLPAY